MSPLLPVPASTSARVRDLLGRAPDGPVEVLHTGPLAAYVAIGDRVVGVLATGAARVPCGLRTRLPSLPAVTLARVTAGGLHVDGLAVRVTRSVDVRVPRRSDVAGDPHPLTPDEVDALVGRGDGLTPYGDDVLCGWLAAHRAHGVATPGVDAAVRAALPRTTRLSAELLTCALDGEVLPELASWLAARDDASAAAVLGIGASSGAGLLEGARLALDHLDRLDLRETSAA